MHDSAITNCKKFINKYLKDGGALKVLDVGSFDVNGSMRPLFEEHDPDVKYTGLDHEKGKGVDVVQTHRWQMPFSDNYFNVLVSSSCLEHNTLFWLTFKEMVRVVKPKGLIYINTPSEGAYHGYPGDCWRFKKDAYAALTEWEPQARLVEQYIDDKSPDQWHDNIGIFVKQESHV